ATTEISASGIKFCTLVPCSFPIRPAPSSPIFTFFAILFSFLPFFFTVLYARQYIFLLSSRTPGDWLWLDPAPPPLPPSPGIRRLPECQTGGRSSHPRLPAP